ncbi:hypothetical protein ROHU_009160 [Labeo rohita]|uniref:Fucolectin tachylectin-4 pentraxin-1 domain-containing protein n=1 Tax=Labeo rohita TaxID=84645 RepID=A0A498LZZ9_LABRO|nr:hypothetical protein ROHU_009160 [Labeo rohita]
MEDSRCDRREPRLCCNGKESPICRGVRSVTPTDRGLMLRSKGAAALLHRCSVISTLADGATDTFSCGGMKGRYMIVHIPGDQKILSLSEIGVYGDLAGNVAVDGAATQSSMYMDWFAEKAIDSNRGLQRYPSCSSTLHETNPWWRLDLHDVYKFSKVVITNRNDCCAEQINGVEIRIGNSLENNGNDNPICAVIPAIPAGQSYSYSCGGMEGRYVNLIIPGDMKILTLCEVEVYGQGPSQHCHVGPVSGADLVYPTGTQLILSIVSIVAPHGLMMGP